MVRRCTRPITGAPVSARVNAGDTLTLRVRGGEGVREVQVTAAAPAAPAEPTEDASLGLRLRAIPNGRSGSSLGAAAVERRARRDSGGRHHHGRRRPAVADARGSDARIHVVARGRVHRGRDRSRNRASRDRHRKIMMSWSTSALLLLLGIGVGPYGLNVLSSSVLLLLDPLIAMALAMLGVFIGLDIHLRQPRLTTPAVLAVLGGIAMAAVRDSSPIVLGLITPWHCRRRDRRRLRRLAAGRASRFRARAAGICHRIAVAAWRGSCLRFAVGSVCRAPRRDCVALRR